VPFQDMLWQCHLDIILMIVSTLNIEHIVLQKHSYKEGASLWCKLVNENRNDWDENLSIVLFSYQIAYKVGTCHTPFQLVYGLHPLLPTKYLLPSRIGENWNPQPVRVLTSRLFELEKL
jgi:hypothetical protein